MSLWEAKSGFTEHVRYLNVAPINYKLRLMIFLKLYIAENVEILAGFCILKLMCFDVQDMDPVQHRGIFSTTDHQQATDTYFLNSGDKIR